MCFSELEAVTGILIREGVVVLCAIAQKQTLQSHALLSSGHCGQSCHVQGGESCQGPTYQGMKTAWSMQVRHTWQEHHAVHILCLELVR